MYGSFICPVLLVWSYKSYSEMRSTLDRENISRSESSSGNSCHANALHSRYERATAQLLAYIFNCCTIFDIHVLLMHKVEYQAHNNRPIVLHNPAPHSLPREGPRSRNRTTSAVVERLEDIPRVVAVHWCVIHSPGGQIHLEQNRLDSQQ